MGALGTVQSKASQTSSYTFQEYTFTFLTQSWQALGMDLIFHHSSHISSPFSGRSKWLFWTADQYFHQNSCLGIKNVNLERHLLFLSFPCFAHPCSCNFLQFVFLLIPFLLGTTKIPMKDWDLGGGVQLTPLILFLYFLLESSFFPPLFFIAFWFLHNLFITLVAYCIISTDNLCPNIVLCFFLRPLWLLFWTS